RATRRERRSVGRWCRTLSAHASRCRTATTAAGSIASTRSRCRRCRRTRTTPRRCCCDWRDCGLPPTSGRSHRGSTSRTSRRTTSPTTGHCIPTPATVDNGQQNITQEIRLQSADPNARLLWTTGAFFAENRQSYLEQIHDPMLQEIITALMPGSSIVDVFGVGYDPAFPTDGYFLKTDAKDEQYALFGELNYGLTDRLKGTLGARFSRTKYSFDTLTGGPQLFAPTAPGSGSNQENAFTPRVG